MEGVKDWTREYFLSNQETCLQTLSQLSVEDRTTLKENLENCENNKIVLLTGMIVDTQEPEFYCEKYEVKGADGSVRIEPGKYADKLNINESEIVEDPSKYLNERKTILISLPSSTNQWVHEVDASLRESCKRKLEKDKITEAFTVKVSLDCLPF